MTYFNDMCQLFLWVMSQVSAWCKSPDIPRVPTEQKRAITKGNKLDYFILSSLFFFSPIYYCWWCDRKCGHRFIYLGSGYVMWTLEWVGKVLESILPKRQLLERILFRNSVALLWCPWIPGKHLWDVWGWFCYWSLLWESHFLFGVKFHINWYILCTYIYLCGAKF